MGAMRAQLEILLLRIPTYTSAERRKSETHAVHIRLTEIVCGTFVHLQRDSWGEPEAHQYMVWRLAAAMCELALRLLVQQGEFTEDAITEFRRERYAEGSSYLAPYLKFRYEQVYSVHERRLSVTGRNSVVRLPHRWVLRDNFTGRGREAPVQIPYRLQYDSVLSRAWKRLYLDDVRRAESMLVESYADVPRYWSVEYKDTFVSDYIPGMEAGFATLAEAQAAGARRGPRVSITYEPDRKRYTLRAGTTRITSPTGESSWLPASSLSLHGVYDTEIADIVRRVSDAARAPARPAIAAPPPATAVPAPRAPSAAPRALPCTPAADGAPALLTDAAAVNAALERVYVDYRYNRHPLTNTSYGGDIVCARMTARAALALHVLCFLSIPAPAAHRGELVPEVARTQVHTRSW
jgi:hypothetical protein